MPYVIKDKHGQFLFGNKTFTQLEKYARKFVSKWHAEDHVRQWFYAGQVIIEEVKD